mgnify:CR=1 FL=1
MPQPQQRDFRREENPPLVPKDEIEKIIKGDTRLLVQKADFLGKHFRNSLSTSQIRNVFGNVKRMEQKGFEKSKKEFLLLKPKLAYSAGREPRLRDLEKVLTNAIDSVGNSESFENFCKFFEAILCYHRFYGGK